MHAPDRIDRRARGATRSCVSLFWLALTLLQGAILWPTATSAATGAGSDPVTLDAVIQDQAAVPRGGRRPRGDHLDPALVRLGLEHRHFRARARAGERFEASQPGLMMSRDDYVLVDITLLAADPASVRARLETLGLRDASLRGRVLSGWFPAARLDELSQVEGIGIARPSYRTTFAGSVTSQGDAALRAADARLQSGVDGTGLMVGVLSDSYNCKGGAATDVANGELPAGVVVLREYGSCTQAADEGRAMLQIVHDLAPGASLAFYTAFNGIADFANGIQALRNAGADVIVDDVLYFSELMFQDGVVAQAVDNVVAQGATYFSAATNLTRQSYESDFRATTVTGWSSNFRRHDFDPGTGVDTLQRVTMPASATVSISLQWDQPSVSAGGSGPTTNVDLVLYDMSGTRVAIANSNNPLTGEAVEVLQFTNPNAVATDYQLAIEYRNTQTPPGRVKYVWSISSGSFAVQEYATNSSPLYGHANAAGARAVAAASYTNTPAFGRSPPVVQPYSSSGGTAIYFTNAGVRLAQPVTRPKPEIVAVDAVSTSVPGFTSFGGTSAAAPHAGAVAALLQQLDPTAPPARIYEALQENALEMDIPGFDTRTGLGLIQADTAASYVTLDAGPDAVLGFASDVGGVPLGTTVANTQFQSVGVTLRDTTRSDSLVSVAAGPPNSPVGQFAATDLLAGTTAANAGLELSFSPTIGEAAFGYAAVNGALVADLYNGSNVLVASVPLLGTTSIPFPAGTMLAGATLLTGFGELSRIVLRNTGSDSRLRLDTLRYAPFTTDRDGDGIFDAREDAGCTSRLDRDSDDDGLADGTEDANRNGTREASETDPCLADTDGDGLPDGLESGVTVPVADPDGSGPLLGTNLAIFVPDADPSTTTSPLLGDTDGDGAGDGVEDANRNGRVDAGEFDPNNAASVPPRSTRQVPLPVWSLALVAALLLLAGAALARHASGAERA